MPYQMPNVQYQSTGVVINTAHQLAMLSVIFSQSTSDSSKNNSYSK